MDESALIRDAKRGDLDAFNRLVLEYQDLAYNVAKVSSRDGAVTELKSISGHLCELGELSKRLLGKALDAWASKDVKLAADIDLMDDEIDDLYGYINHRLLAVSKTEPQLASRAIYLLEVAHQLERVADRATNICEWVVYAVTGKLVEININDSERTSLQLWLEKALTKT